MDEVGKHFNIHPLVLEDILNPSKRPKFEDYGDFLFLIMRMVYPDKVKNRIASEQISLVIGPGFVLSFQEQGGDVLNSVRERLRKGRAKLRSLGSDYLGYALMDAIVDSYFSVLEDLGDEISDVERIVLDDPSEKIVRRIHRIKRSAITLRRAAWPQRELIHAMERCENSLLTHTTRLYLRDVYDHAVEIIDVIENFREMSAAQMEVYLSSVSNRMNSVMVVLAVVSTIFMPLTFIVGVYGMNFKYMPELEMRLGYPAVLLVMFLIAAGMIGFFRRREWM